MARRTLLDFYDDLARTPGGFLVHDDGYRTWSFSYAETAAASESLAARLRAADIGRGQAVAIWGENRAEWIFALWGCLLEGVVVVPIDYRASAEFLTRVADIVDAKAILVGDTPDADSLSAAPGESGRQERPVWRLAELRTPGAPPPPDRGLREQITGNDTAEIIFTSGATADPKGVIITHRNILANIIPIEHEMAKYRKYAKPFLPIRFLNLLPLSHMFGQSMATFVPPMLPGVVVFTRSYAPEDIVRQIRDRRVSVLVCVPKMLEVLREHVVRLFPEAANPVEQMHWTRRWWRYRKIHRLFGFKFWAMVVGAAPLDPDLEAFWGRLGFLVIQGYGLTETAPIVTLNHPLRLARGAVGKPIHGVEVRIAEDGEILVRGDNVTSGYYNAPEATREAFKDGWFHTGDIGALDDKGQLHIRGRKKEMIVTPEGLNVFPDDIERVLNALPGVRESAVVGAALGGSTAERVQAILVADQGLDLDDTVRRANAQLADHQKIRAAALWPGDELPRTEGTRKLKRRELRLWLQEGQSDKPAGGATRGGGRSVASVLERFAPGRTLESTTTLDELGLSSLERVELMMALEEAFQVTIDEAGFAAASTVGDLEALTRPLEASTGAQTRAVTPEPFTFPVWNRSLPARTLRRASLATWILPATRPWVSLDVKGLEHIDGIKGPVIFAANHQSHLDGPVLLRALPPRWRYRVAPAMLKEFFQAHFHPTEHPLKARVTSSLNYYLASLFFNAFPLPQREAGTRRTLRYIGDLVGAGYSLLIFPEGKRTEAGEIIRFQPGVAMIASRLDIPVVPVRLDGLHRILHESWSVPVRGRATVTFGSPMSLTGNDYSALSAMVEQAVKEL
ncbi:AMP-binding protein [soil metagenome]